MRLPLRSRVACIEAIADDRTQLREGASNMLRCETVDETGLDRHRAPRFGLSGRVSCSPAVCDRQKSRRRRPPHAQTASATPTVSVPPAVATATGGLPDLTVIAAQAVQGRRQYFVRAGGPPAELSLRQRSVLRIFLRRPPGSVRLARSARAQPRIGRADLRRRLHRHQQPRDRQREGRRDRGVLRQTRGAGASHRHRQGDRSRARQSGQARATAA